MARRVVSFKVATSLVLAALGGVALAASGGCASGGAGAGGGGEASSSGTTSTSTSTSSGASSSSSGSSSSSSGAGGGSSGSSSSSSGGGGAPNCGPAQPDMGPTTPSCNVVLAPPTGSTVTLALTVLQLPNNNVVANVPVKACAAADLTCAQPLTTATTDANGLAKLTLPTGANGFDGYAEINGAGLVPELLFVSNPIAKDTTYTTWVATPNTLNLVSGIFGVPIDMSRGAIAASLSDCTAGMTGLVTTIAAADGCSIIGYNVNGFPTQGAASSDASGVGYGFNIPVGETEVFSRIAATQALLGKTKVQVRAGTLTAIGFAPTP